MSVSEQSGQTAPEPSNGAAAGNWRTVAVDWMETLRKALFNGLVILAILAIIWFMYLDISRKPVIIEEFGLPEPLEQRGFSGAVAAQRVWDAMSAIQIAARTEKETQSLLSETRQLDVVEPGTGLSLKNLTQMVRTALRIEPTLIAGEVICATEACEWDALSLRLRVFSEGRMHIIDSGALAGREPDQVFRDVALKALRIVDPYVVAAYLFGEKGGLAESERLATRLVDTEHPQSAWAANLLGNHALLRKDYAAALDWFDLSVRLAATRGERGFALPHYGRGNSLLAMKEHAEAMAAFDRAIALDQGFAAPHFGKGQVYLEQEEPERAARAFARATALKPAEAAYWSALGKALARIEGAEANALKHLKRAVRMNGRSAALRTELGEFLLDVGQYDEAVDQLKLATVIDADWALGWDRLGSALTLVGEFGRATAAIERARTLDPNLDTDFAATVIGRVSRIWASN